jgi:hypothetical protein
MDAIAPATAHPTESLDPKLRRDLKTLARFIELYCGENHPDAARQAVSLRTHDVRGIAGSAIALCPACTQLLTHAFVKRSHCPMNPKPACKHCPAHCYHPRYRAAIGEVMRFSGRRMVIGGRLDYLIHLLF